MLKLKLTLALVVVLALAAQVNAQAPAPFTAGGSFTLQDDGIPIVYAFQGYSANQSSNGKRVYYSVFLPTESGGTLIQKEARKAWSQLQIPLPY